MTIAKTAQIFESILSVLWGFKMAKHSFSETIFKVENEIIKHFLGFLRERQGLSKIKWLFLGQKNLILFKITGKFHEF